MFQYFMLNMYLVAGVPVGALACYVGRMRGGVTNLG